MFMRAWQKGTMGLEGAKKLMKKAGFRRKAAPQCLHLLLRTLECLFGVRGWSVLFSHGWVDSPLSVLALTQSVTHRPVCRVPWWLASRLGR